ncbi:uncharacterized protein BJ212DRAFT_1495432 [Suillus subaureus]|uniref:Uncharacterized protein n=1 Tax=Suillus subaureus TaxID=48587 RepID=A0A9P7EF67_9AGAM|nr:uncharacterized protein BJ212DRAFT_1495432 [Suillus subaureus]KAG1819103.1 hypothetical protein BJ212DRAFT_1495432 [Suillus subaureus]
MFTRRTVMRMEDTALSVALPRLDEWLAAMEVEPYLSPPIISDGCWEKFGETLPVIAPLMVRYQRSRLWFWSQLYFEALGRLMTLHKNMVDLW